MPRGSAGSSPQERAQFEAAEAYQKLQATEADLETTAARHAALEKEVAYRRSLLATTTQHPDLPEDFDVEQFVASLPAEPEKPKRGRKPKESTTAADVPAAATVVENTTGEAEATIAPAASNTSDDPFGDTP